MTRRLGLLALFVFALTTTGAGQRDASPSPALAGTSAIAGTVIAADSPPQPLRRVVVTLTGGARPRSVLTDDAGRFVFAALPEGTYTVTARKAAYLAAAYGARRPGRSGTSIALAAGQRADISISMFRGGVISGMLRDGAGVPLGGIDVRALDARTLDTPVSEEIATTDDRGVFRFYGLAPGDYILAALPPGGGEIAAPAAEEIDARLASLNARHSIGGPPSRPAPSRPPTRVGVAPIFYPGTPYSTEAARVRVDAGGERSGIDFQVNYLPVASVDGMVAGDVPDLSRVQVTLIPVGPRVATTISSLGLAGRPIDTQGRFQYANLTPGRYRIVARATRGAVAPAGPTMINGVLVAGGGRAGGGPPAAAPSGGSAGTDYLYGYADVDVRGEDIAGVSLVLTPGKVVTGRLVVSATGANPRPDDLTGVGVTLLAEGGGWQVGSGGLSMGTGIVNQSIAATRPDGTFEIRGIGPARFALRVAPPADLAKIWRARTAHTGGRDLFDETIEMLPGSDIADVVVTLTDARTELSGTLQTGQGQPATDCYIVAMTTDRSQWRPRSRRVLSTRPATDGRYVFADLPAGEYLLIALTDLDPLDLADPAFLEQLAPAGVKVTVAEGEKKAQDLRMR